MRGWGYRWRFREARADALLTQGELASAIGVSRQTINAIERGRSTPRLALAIQLATLLRCPADELFSTKPPPRRVPFDPLDESHHAQAATQPS